MRVFLFLTFFILQTETPRQVMLLLLDDNQQPVAGQVIRLQVYTPSLRDECITDENGRCPFTFTAAGELLQGRLVIVGRGTRPIIWKGETLEVTLQLDAAGQLTLATDHLPAETAVPMTPAPTPTVVLNAPTAVFAAPTIPTVIPTVIPDQETAVSPLTITPTTTPTTLSAISPTLVPTQSNIATLPRRVWGGILAAALATVALIASGGWLLWRQTA